MSLRAGLRIGLVGCGRWGKNILRDLVSLDCEVHVVAQDLESKSNAQENGAHEIVERLSMLEPDLDGYVVAVPTTCHREVVEQLIPRGKPVYVEKPLTSDTADAAKLVDLGRGRLFVMDKWRYHPGVNAIRDIICSARFGRLRALNLRRRQWGSAHSDVDPIWILLPHDLSIVLHLLGDIPEPLFASCLGGEGWLNALTVYLGTEVPVSIEVSSLSAQHERFLEAVFDEGTVTMRDDQPGHLLIRYITQSGQSLGELELRDVDGSLPLLLELQAFLDFLRGGEPPMSSVEEGQLIVQRVEQCRKLALVQVGAGEKSSPVEQPKQ
tara:strand:+ start:238 stop:1209 length:972 start_codon:yes stop_codon:yes gene_type:complete